MSDRFPNKCSYVPRNRIVCGAPCINDRCHNHYNRKEWVDCTGCQKPTLSKYGYCTPCGIQAAAERSAEKKRLKNLAKIDMKDLPELKLEAAAIAARIMMLEPSTPTTNLVVEEEKKGEELRSSFVIPQMVGVKQKIHITQLKRRSD